MVAECHCWCLWLMNVLLLMKSYSWWWWWWYCSSCVVVDAGAVFDEGVGSCGTCVMLSVINVMHFRKVLQLMNMLYVASSCKMSVCEHIHQHHTKVIYLIISSDTWSVITEQFTPHVTNRQKRTIGQPGCHLMGNSRRHMTWNVRRWSEEHTTRITLVAWITNTIQI